MTLSYFAVMLMFDTFCSCFGAMSRKEKNKFLKTDFPVCLLPALECLNGRMDEILCFLLSERKGKTFNYVGCQVLRQTVHISIFVRSQTAINLFENTCEDILNLSKVVGNKNKIYQPYSSTFVSQSLTSDIIHFSSFKARFLKN